ncbi:MAG TPA: RNA-binding protein, partial [Candidatus Obscuribacterales bacterium]
MPQTLFVSNLPSQITDHELETIFSRHGRVLRAWLEQPSPSAKGHRSTRKGFVEMHPEDAENVIWILNGSWYKTNCLDVQSE